MDGRPTVAHPLVPRALDGQGGIARLAIALDRPVVGLGASAPLHYAGLSRLLGAECIVPEDTDVANALGAVVGQVRVSVEAQVSQPAEGLFRVSTGAGVRDYLSEDAALAAAEAEMRALAAENGREAGASEAELEVRRELQLACVEGQRIFVGARVTATATGRPRIAA